MKYIYLILTVTLICKSQESVFYSRVEGFYSKASAEFIRQVRNRAIWGQENSQPDRMINSEESKNVILNQHENSDLDIWDKVGRALTNELSARLFAELQECLKKHPVHECIQEK